MDSRIISGASQRIAFFRSTLSSSQKQLVIFSNTAITLENAAKIMNRKNSVPHICPDGI